MVTSGWLGEPANDRRLSNPAIGPRDPLVSVPDGIAVVAEDLRKEFRTVRRDPGFAAALRSLIRPQRSITVAVDDVSLEVRRGEIIGYLGPNAAGKSTTIKMLTGVLVPTSGRALVNGLEPSSQRARVACDIGVVFGQRTQLWWDLPAVESFHILREIYGVSKAAFEASLAELDAYLEISGFWQVPVRQMSLGQRMRCDLAAAMIHSPSVLFLDEPTVGMDLVGREAVRVLLDVLAREKGTTIFLTTHDLGDVQRLCQRVLIIDHGHLIFEGDLQTLAALEGAERTLHVMFADEIDDPQVEGALRVFLDGRKAAFRFPATVNPQEVLIPLASHYPVSDVTVESADFEQVIRLLYKRGRNT